MVSSEPTYDIHVDQNVPVPMRDGTILRADVYQPQAQGRYPVLVGRVGHKLRDWARDFYTPTGEYYARRGYVVVWQNVRGTFASQGRFRPFQDDAWGANRDGYDTVEWAAVQPWSDGAVDAPMMHWNGWFDYRLYATLEGFRGVRARGRSARCRQGQRLVIGPWGHGAPVGGLDFGPGATLDVDAQRLRWYDYWLKGLENGVTEAPAVRVFLMGANRWLALADWPPSQVTARPAYLRAGTGRSEGSLNNGALSFEPPAAAEPPDSFLYDPQDPVPSLRSFEDPGPTDQRAVEGTMLTYTSDVLEQDLTIIGPLKGVL